MVLVAGALALLVGASATARGPIGGRDADWQLAVTQAHKRYATNRSGKPASDPPALATVSPGLFAVAVARLDGHVFEAGDSGKSFTLTGVAAPFAAALVAKQRGPDALNSTLGAVAGLAPLPSARSPADWGSSPSTALKPEGALATLGLLQPQGDPTGKWQALLDNLHAFSGGSPGIDEAIYRSAQAEAANTQSIAKRLAAEGRLVDDANSTADLYLRHGSVAVTARELAVMAVTLANDGVNPVTRHTVVEPAVAQNIQQLITQAGIRGGKNSTLNKVRLIATAASSGAILVIVPGRAGIAVYSPPLDSAGVSVRGQLALRYLSQALMLNVDPNAP